MNGRAIHAGDGADTTAAALLHMLARNARLGQYKLALRHWLMLCERGAPVPANLVAYCERARARCKPRELVKIEKAVADWTAMCSPRSRWWLALDAGNRPH